MIHLVLMADGSGGQTVGLVIKRSEDRRVGCSRIQCRVAFNAGVFWVHMSATILG